MLMHMREAEGSPKGPRADAIGDEDPGPGSGRGMVQFAYYGSWNVRGWWLWEQ